MQEDSNGPIPTLSFNKVEKTYGNVTALSEFSLDIYAGEIVAILGANGAGKSTFVNLASGGIQADRGQVKVFGKDPASQEVKMQRRILPQDLNFPNHLKVREILNLIFAHYPETNFQNLSLALGLNPLLERLCSALSGGERRKLAIACALAGSPRLVLLDEPTANIDLLGQEHIHQLFLSYFKSSGRSLVFSSHQMQEVENLADRVVILSKGKIVANSPTKELRGLMGMKKVKFLPSHSLQKLQSTSKIDFEKDHVIAYGSNSDEILKEVIAADPRASGFEVTLPSLEEAILKIWNQGGLQ